MDIVTKLLEAADNMEKTATVLEVETQGREKAAASKLSSDKIEKIAKIKEEFSIDDDSLAEKVAADSSLESLLRLNLSANTEVESMGSLDEDFSKTAGLEESTDPLYDWLAN